MVYRDGRAEQVKIAYIGGGSRGWGWGLMSDLASCGDMSGDVYLYDIDFSAAQHNEVIGNLYRNAEGARCVELSCGAERRGGTDGSGFCCHLDSAG